MGNNLTIWTATVNGAGKLQRILPSLRQVADQLVVGVDDSSSDGSEEVAREFADTVLLIPHRHYERLNGDPTHVSALEVALPHFRGDWILRVDHDETLGPALSDKSHLRSLLDDRYVTNYWMPRRWVVPPGDRFISSHPWHVDWHMRLYRNLPSIIQFSKKVHHHTTLLGEARFLTNEWLVHWDLVWHSREMRESKVRFCEGLSNYSGAEYYLYEEKEYETLPLEHVPASAKPAHIAAAYDDPLACSIELLDCPLKMQAGQYYYALLGIRNLSQRVFFPPSSGHYPGNVFLSYHWYRDSAGGSNVHSWDHPRSAMPVRLLPGQCASTYIRVQAPHDPGVYALQPDLLEEGVAWTSNSLPVSKYSVKVR